MAEPDPLIDGWVVDYLADQVVRSTLADTEDARHWASLLQTFLGHIRKVGDRVQPSGPTHQRLITAKFLAFLRLHEPKDLVNAVPVFLKLHSPTELRSQPVLSLLLMTCTQAVLQQVQLSMEDATLCPLIEKAYEPALQACKDLALPTEWQRVFEDSIKELLTLLDPERGTIHREVLRELLDKHNYDFFLQQMSAHIDKKASVLERPVLIQLAEERTYGPSMWPRGPPPMAPPPMSRQPITLSALRSNFRGSEQEWARVIDGRHRDVQQFYAAQRAQSGMLPSRSPARGPPAPRGPSGYAPLPPRPVEPPRQFEVARQLQESRRQLMSVINDPLEEIERSIHGSRPSAREYMSPRRSSRAGSVHLTDDVEDEDTEVFSSYRSVSGARRRTAPLVMTRAAASADDDVEESQEQASSDEHEETEEQVRQVKRPRLRDADTSRVEPLPKEKIVPRDKQGSGKRTRFQPWEVTNLLDGLKRFGHNWAQIRAHYEFLDRTAGDLKDKYRNLLKSGSIPPDQQIPKDA